MANRSDTALAVGSSELPPPTGLAAMTGAGARPGLHENSYKSQTRPHKTETETSAEGDPDLLADEVTKFLSSLSPKSKALLTDFTEGSLFSLGERLAGWVNLGDAVTDALSAACNGYIMQTQKTRHCLFSPRQKGCQPDRL